MSGFVSPSEFAQVWSTGGAVHVTAKPLRAYGLVQGRVNEP